MTYLFIYFSNFRLIKLNQIESDDNKTLRSAKCFCFRFEVCIRSSCFRFVYHSSVDRKTEIISMKIRKKNSSLWIQKWNVHTIRVCVLDSFIFNMMRYITSDCSFGLDRSISMCFDHVPYIVSESFWSMWQF